MVAFVTCTPCLSGNCDGHIDQQSPEGLIGGVACPCKHTPEDKARYAKQREQGLAAILGADANEDESR